ncbi:MAG: DUF4976 domain-containing protein, partial [Anaerolineae bacterium]|nr:DUF4976 domain-containing protein [Anaerolineae bacterium]
GMDSRLYMQGRSVAALLRVGKSDTPLREFVRSEHYAATNLADETHASMYRDRRWKLTVYHQKGICELYDHDADPWENTDLSEDPDYADVKWDLLRRSYDATVYAHPVQTDRYGPF